MAGLGGAQEIRANTIVTVETLVHSLQGNKLIWAGRSRTTNPTRVDHFVMELAEAAAQQIRRAGL